jgi:DNA-directed RNA polymerase subunit omega
MARVTIEDCLEKVENRFILIHMAAKRVRQFKNGDLPVVKSSNREVVTALREIAAGKLRLVPKQSKKGTSPAVKKDVEAKPSSAPISQEGLQQAEERLYGEAIVPGKAISDMSGESPH